MSLSVNVLILEEVSFSIRKESGRFLKINNLWNTNSILVKWRSWNGGGENIGQCEIMNYLLKQEKPVGRQEISKGTGIDAQKVSKTLKIMIKHKDIKFIEVDYRKAQEVYGVHRRMRIYYVQGEKVKRK